MVSFDTSSLSDSVLRSIKSAEHLGESDEGTVTAAMQLAKMIEQQQLDLGDSGGDMKTLNTSYQTLQRYLTELGLSPQGRRNLGLEGEEDEEDDW